jgi:hypothetical protein
MWSGWDQLSPVCAPGMVLWTAISATTSMLPILTSMADFTLPNPRDTGTVPGMHVATVGVEKEATHYLMTYSYRTVSKDRRGV